MTNFTSPMPIMPMPEHLPASMAEAVGLLPENKRLILFTRHSLREHSDGKGFASMKLPLTPAGRTLAKAWGQWLANNLAYSMDVDSLSSPIQRCVDTAILMQEGAGLNNAISHQTLLVEPGSFVLKRQPASQIFREIGALNFINRFLAKQLAGTKTPYQGGLDLLKLFYEHQPQAGHLLLAVSHDTLLVVFLAVMMGVEQIDKTDWPKMMEGVFLWFDDMPFDEVTVHFIWRGKVYEKVLKELIEE